MRPPTANENLLLWAHVREFAVPPSMVESAAARRAVGDWAGACAAARVDVDLNLRAVRRDHGSWLAAQVRGDLRQLAPDLLRWHYPRVGPEGLLRPGLTLTLARYPPTADSGSETHLVARTPPAWAQAGQRISLALWMPSRPSVGAGLHPHPRPDPRFRLDLHRHLWDVRRVGELRERSGRWPCAGGLAAARLPAGVGACAVDRWPAEATLLLRARGCGGDVVAVRLSTRHRLTLNLGSQPEVTVGVGGRGVPVLPDAATWVLPDLRLLHAGLIDRDQLHPLVAAGLGHRPAGSRSPDGAGTSRLVDCRGATHRIGVVNGALVALDHDPDEIRREELLGALGGTELPCLRAIDQTHRHPDTLAEIRARLDHGDTAGALAAVEALLGPDVPLRDGALRDELETAVHRRTAHRLYRAGLAGPAPLRSTQDTRRRGPRTRPRHAAGR